MTQHEVLIVGAGPTGLMLAGELALAGVDVAVVERRPTQQVEGVRARGLNARSLEVLDQRGLAQRFLAEGTTHQKTSFGWIPLKIGDLPSRHNYGLGLLQTHIERILAGWVDEFRVPIHRGRSAVRLAQDEAGADVELDDGQRLSGRYLVGCDGGRSFVRKAAGIAFPGWGPTISNLLAEVRLAETPPWGLRRDEHGIFALSPTEDGEAVGVMVTEQEPGRTGEPTLRSLSEALVAGYGTDFGAHSPRWISRFTDTARQAASYRSGRVLLAGDAAHVHYPVGGQGLNLGMQDAVNLGWKLAQVVRGVSPEGLLDSYHAERHPVAARVLRDTMAQVELLRRSNEHAKALYEVMAELLSMEEPRKRITCRMAGLDVHYDLGGVHPLVGRRMPDLDLMVAGRRTRVCALLHEARAVLLNFGEPGGVEIGPWSGRVRQADASYEGAWELPLLGAVAAPSAVLVRPDGYAAWVGEGAQAGLTQALAAWFGPPAA
jgi:2-polyprenyl-6-methoxyphenol hydroxylase-like FAD-dependent oxidoreductase